MLLNSLSQQAMEKSMDAVWMKMQVHADNLANYSTPDYKAKRVDFSQVLKNVQDDDTGKIVFRTTVTTDETTEARVDGNNVDMEYEQLELWKAQAQYAALTTKISGEFTNLRTIINTVGR
ncbi:MAG: flagellar biosynthesis protein FlgB [Oscillospiraceae bacterium]|nr:flagellar biosynthesis protein FlgB [Oscillospiraceae bacterium]